MSIQILSDSFNEHRTVDSIEVTTKYIMSSNDYLRGWGDLYDSEWNFLYTMYLPWEGDNFGLYYNTTYLADCLLVDITTENTQGVTDSFDAEGTDESGFDYHKKIIVTYSWSNSGEADTKRKNEASSWKIRYDTTLDFKSSYTYIDSVTDQKFDWADKYLTAKNPTIKMTKTDSDGEEEEVDYGAYNSASDSIKQKYIDTIRDTIPQLDIREPHTTCTATTYSSNVAGSTLATYVGSVNSEDFLKYIYTKKEEALIAKNKLESYDENDWIEADDSGKWMFIDWSMNDLGSGFYEYEYTFEYNKNGWNYYFEYVDGENDIELYPNIYPVIEFYTTIFAGQDFTSPNERDSL